MAVKTSKFKSVRLRHVNAAIRTRWLCTSIPVHSHELPFSSPTAISFVTSDRFVNFDGTVEAVRDVLQRLGIPQHGPVYVRPTSDVCIDWEWERINKIVVKGIGVPLEVRQSGYMTVLSYVEDSLGEFLRSVNETDGGVSVGVGIRLGIEVEFLTVGRSGALVRLFPESSATLWETVLGVDGHRIVNEVRLPPTGAYNILCILEYLRSVVLKASTLAEKRGLRIISSPVKEGCTAGTHIHFSVPSSRWSYLFNIVFDAFSRKMYPRSYLERRDLGYGGTNDMRSQSWGIEVRTAPAMLHAPQYCFALLLHIPLLFHLLDGNFFPSRMIFDGITYDRMIERILSYKPTLEPIVSVIYSLAPVPIEREWERQSPYMDIEKWRSRVLKAYPVTWTLEDITDGGDE